MFEEKVKMIVNEIPKLLKEAGMKIPLDMQKLIESNTNVGTFKKPSVMEQTWNKTAKINNWKTLVSSFTEGKSHSLTKSVNTNDNLKITIGSDLVYAGVQEFGMFIKSKGKMQNYFWAKYYESKKKNPYFRIMALSVIKKGGIEIKARPYFNPALKKLQELQAYKYIQNILKRLLELF
jgi:hypothetical protein